MKGKLSLTLMKYIEMKSATTIIANTKKQITRTNGEKNIPIKSGAIKSDGIPKEPTLPKRILLPNP